MAVYIAMRRKVIGEAREVIRKRKNRDSLIRVYIHQERSSTIHHEMMFSALSDDTRVILEHFKSSFESVDTRLKAMEEQIGRCVTATGLEPSMQSDGLKNAGGDSGK